MTRSPSVNLERLCRLVGASGCLADAARQPLARPAELGLDALRATVNSFDISGMPDAFPLASPRVQAVLPIVCAGLFLGGGFAFLS